MTVESDEDYTDYEDYYIITKNKSAVIGKNLLNIRNIFDIKGFVNNKIIILDHESEIPVNAKCFIEYLKANVYTELINKFYADEIAKIKTSNMYYFNLYNFIFLMIF